MKRISPTTLDIAIIGGGVSGLYCGWRLKNDNASKNQKTAIFEMSERIGGRLHTIKMHALDKLPLELGGMRFMAHQQLVKKVIETFELEVADFPMGQAQTNINYLRRQRFTDADWQKADFNHRYHLDEHNLHKSPDTLFQALVDNILSMPANQAVLKDNDLSYTPGSMVFFDREQWDKIKHQLVDDNPNSPDKGVRLENIGFWNLIRSQLSSEGFELLADGGGYYSNTLNWNSAEALPYVVGDFTGDVSYQTLAAGFDQIARALYQHYHDPQSIDGSGQVLTQMQLCAISQSDDSLYPYLLSVKDLESQITHKVLCRQVILAMPRRSLELISSAIDLGTKAQHKAFEQAISCVIAEPSFKLLMAFDEPWWQSVKVPGTDKQIEHGHGTTDMAMRQCYYFGTQYDEASGKTHAAMLASYNDMRTVSFWKPLEKDGHDSQGLAEVALFEPKWRRQGLDLSNSVSGPLADYGDYQQAPVRMVNHALNQLSELHDYPVPEPIDTAYFNWADDPYGGGYHAWKANYCVGEMMAKMRNAPFPGEALHVCGEAYSDQQGWVEGAFCIAEQMLIDNFGVTRLIADYYLGR